MWAGGEDVCRDRKAGSRQGLPRGAKATASVWYVYVLGRERACISMGGIGGIGQCRFEGVERVRLCVCVLE